MEIRKKERKKERMCEDPKIFEVLIREIKLKRWRYLKMRINFYL